MVKRVEDREDWIAELDNKYDDYVVESLRSKEIAKTADQGIRVGEFDSADKKGWVS